MPQLPPGLVARERLFDALDEATKGPLTLLVGPAGTGKSAVVSSWISSGRPQMPVAWLSLDASDDSRPRFWRLMLAALAATGASSEEAAGELAVASDNTVDTVLPALVGALNELRHPILLVLDDFDEITDPAIMADMELLLRTPPPALRLVATARRVPSLRLQRLRLSGAVTEIDPRALTFTEDEAALLLEGTGAALEPDDLRRLWERTEGWAAGLRLTAMALRGRTDATDFVSQFAGDEAPVADYLFEEILTAQPPHIREFLLRTSITDTICGDLADALTGQSGGGSTLTEMHQDGIMATALDDHREWFRYHGLFRGLLRSVQRREDPTLVPELHRRAAAWLLGRGRETEAARHAAAAQDWELLADVVTQAGFTLLVRGELSELADVLKQVPSSVLRANPSYALAIAGGALETGDVRDAATWLSLCDEHAELVRPQDREGFGVGRAIIGLYRSRLTGDVSQAEQDALVLMGGDRDPADAGTYPAELRSLALINLGALELWTGRLAEAHRDLAEGTEIAASRGLEYLELYGRAHLAVYHQWMGQTMLAERTATDALELADRRGWRGTARASVALGVLGINALVRGEVEEADAALAAASRAVARSVERPLRAHITANTARLMRVQGRPEDALRAFAEVRADLSGGPFWAPLAMAVTAHEALALHETDRTAEGVAVLEEMLAAAEQPTREIAIALARIRLDQGRPGDALALLLDDERVGEAALPTSRVGALVLRALAHDRLGEETAAGDTFAAALALAAPFQCRVSFLVRGEEVLDLLDEHVRTRTADVDFARDLIERLSARVAGRPVAVVAPAEPAVRPPAAELSDRELAVLRYLPTMMSNREIADELFVSVNTVKTHLKQIYRKLDAHDRRDAVTRARRLGLLAPPATR